MSLLHQITIFWRVQSEHTYNELHLDEQISPEYPEYPNYRIERKKEEAERDPNTKSLPYELSGCTVEGLGENGRGAYVRINGNYCHKYGYGLNQDVTLDKVFNDLCKEIETNRFVCENVNIDMWDIPKTNRELGKNKKKRARKKVIE